MCTNPTTEKFSLRNASPLLLMGALVIALMITPILEQRFHSRAILYAGVTLVLVIGVFVNGRRQMLFIPSLVLALLTISVTWSTLIADYAALFVISCLLATLFYALIAGVMLILVLTRHLATVQSVFGAVCVYLLLGLGWAELYWAAAGGCSRFPVSSRRCVGGPRNCGWQRGIRGRQRIFPCLF